MINNFDKAYLSVESLFDVSKSPSNEDIATASRHVEELVNNAKSGNADAIELLANFASGDHTSEIRQIAEQSLMDIYFSKDTGAHIKSQIEEHAFALFELAQSKPGFQVSVQLLYLAAQIAHDRNFDNREEQINKCLDKQIFPEGHPGEAEESLTCSSRLITQSELMVASEKNINVAKNVLSLEDSTFLEDVQTIAAGVITGEQKIISTVVNTGNHWVSLIVQLDLNNVVNCYVRDSNGSTGNSSKTEIGAHLRKALGSQMKFTFFGPSMQANVPNACGALHIRLLDKIGKKFINSHKNIEEIIEDDIRQWNELTPDEQKAIVIGIRASLFSDQARVMKTNRSS
jgi:hypothetical protein